jgi:MFS family permease
MLVYSLAGIGVGHLVDQIGVRTTMLLGSAILGFGLAAISLAQEVWHLYLLYAAAIGFGSSAVGYIPMVKTLSMRAGSRLGFAIGLFNVGLGVGSLVSGPVLQLVIDAAGWRPAAAALGLVVFAILAPLIVLGAPTRAENRSISTTHAASSLGGIWRLPAFWLVMLANTGIGYLMLLPTHQVGHLVQVGVQPLLAATLGGLMGTCIGLGALLGGWIIDRFGAGRLGPVASTLLTFGVLSLIMSSPGAILLWIAYVLAGGIGRGMLGVNTAAFQARAFAGPALGRATGLLELGFGVGAFAGPYLTGLSYDRTGSYVSGLATAILAGIVTAGSILIARRQDRPAERAASRSSSRP